MIEERCGTLIPIQVSTMLENEAQLTIVNPRIGFVRVMNELVADIVERIVYRFSIQLITLIR